MIAIDLSPLTFDARRGVARALKHLLLGLARVPSCPEILRIAPGSIGSPGARRAALADEAQRRGAHVLFSPFTRLPPTDLPCVAWVHEVPFARHGALEGRVRAEKHRQALVATCERAAALIVPSHAVHGDLDRVMPDRRPPVHVIPHGFDPSPWRVAAAHASERLAAARPYALLVGSGARAGGTRKKGLDLFSAAFASGRLAGLEGVLVDAVGGAPRGPWRVALAPDDAALAALLAGARLLVVPSRSEGFGYPLLEAFAAGVPVVAAAAGALPEVSGGAAHLVPPDDAEALTDAIARVHADEALRRSLIAAGRARADAFPPEAMARAWLDVLTPLDGAA